MNALNNLASKATLKTGIKINPIFLSNSGVVFSFLGAILLMIAHRQSFKEIDALASRLEEGMSFMVSTASYLLFVSGILLLWGGFLLTLIGQKKWKIFFDILRVLLATCAAYYYFGVIFFRADSVDELFLQRENATYFFIFGSATFTSYLIALCNNRRRILLWSLVGIFLFWCIASLAMHGEYSRGVEFIED